MKLLLNLGQRYRTLKSKTTIKYGLYQCPYCNNNFEAVSTEIKSKKIKSCGCLRKIKPLDKVINGFTLVKDLGRKGEHRIAIFTCKQCNKNFTTRVTNIVTNKNNSCGCLPKNKTHGQSRTRLYNLFRGMKNRCYNKGRKDQKHYYDKNITIYNQWLENPSLFLTWAINNGYNDNLTIERIDGNKNYTPDNCKFKSYHIQATNKPKIMSSNTSGYKGATYLKNKNKYSSRICINGIRKTIGYFNTAKEAGDAYDNYIIENNLKEYILNKDLLK